MAEWTRAETGVGPLHRVGQPDVERELSALADGAGDQAESEQGDRGLADHHPVDHEHLSAVFAEMIDLRDIERAGAVVDQDHGREQTQVTQAGDQECLLGGRRGGGAVEPEADQEVGGEADQLPEDEQHQQVVGDDQTQHGGREQRHVGEVAAVAAVIAEIAGRVNLDQQRDEGDDDQHDAGESVDPRAQLDV